MYFFFFSPYWSLQAVQNREVFNCDLKEVMACLMSTGRLFQGLGCKITIWWSAMFCFDSAGSLSGWFIRKEHVRDVLLSGAMDWLADKLQEFEDNPLSYQKAAWRLWESCNMVTFLSFRQDPGSGNLKLLELTKHLFWNTGSSSRGKWAAVASVTREYTRTGEYISAKEEQRQH